MQHIAHGVVARDTISTTQSMRGRSIKQASAAAATHGWFLRACSAQPQAHGSHKLHRGQRGPNL
eukprot:8711992-Karenia_brevis.AAC.1